MRFSRTVLVFGLFLASIVIIVMMATFAPRYFRLDSPASRSGDAAAAATAQPETADGQTYFLAKIFEDSSTGGGSTFVGMLEIVQRLLLAVVLSGILAFRPRKNVPLFKRSLFVSQTQILLAVVAAALMMIVGDNAARAFAIFAAVSLVRFRTNIRDPKEITVLLISMALGLAAGIGRWDLGIALCLFALGMLWLLEMREDEATFRSMELSVRTRDPDNTQEILKKIFSRMNIEAEVREIEPPDEKKQIGAIVYYLHLPVKMTTDKLSDRILAADEENIEGIQWSKTKSAADIYQ
jgi:uncharacterized membrane protein YhiD involved in acid resistance